VISLPGGSQQDLPLIATKAASVRMEGLVFYVLQEAVYHGGFSFEVVMLVLITTTAATLCYIHR
jgi:hypothetical protein